MDRTKGLGSICLTYLRRQHEAAPSGCSGLVSESSAVAIGKVQWTKNGRVATTTAQQSYQFVNLFT